MSVESVGLDLPESEDSFFGELQLRVLAVLQLNRHEDLFFPLSPLDSWELSVDTSKRGIETLLLA